VTDEKLLAQGLDALEGLIGLVLEEALDQAVTFSPAGLQQRLRHLADLRQAGTDVVTLADAAATLLRRWRPRP
jgi:hypothetical protein